MSGPKTADACARLLSKVIANRRGKLGEVVLTGINRSGHGRRIPDRRSQFYAPADADALIADGVVAWHAAGGATALGPYEFAYRWAKAQVENQYANLTVEVSRARAQLREARSFSDVDAFLERVAVASEDGDALSLPDLAGDYDPADLVNWMEVERSGQLWPLQQAWERRQALEAAREAEGVREQRLTEFEAEVHRALPGDWLVWLGYRYVPQVQLSEITGTSLRTIASREASLRSKLARLWRDLYGGDLPEELTRRRRHTELATDVALVDEISSGWRRRARGRPPKIAGSGSRT